MPPIKIHATEDHRKQNNLTHVNIDTFYKYT